MSGNKKSASSPISFLFVALFIMAVFPPLFFFRSVDDNRLTSWRWAFGDVNIALFFLLLLTALAVAYGISRFSLLERRPGGSLFLISFAAGALFWGVPEVLVDTSRYFTQAKHLSVNGAGYFIQQWGREIGAWTDMPLIPLIYGLIFQALGESRLWIQIFTTSLFSLTVVTAYHIGKTLWNHDTGFCGALLLLGIPYVFSQVPLMLVDVPTMFLLTLSTYAFMRAMERGRGWIILASAAIYCTAFSKYSTWLMLSVLVVVFLVFLFSPAGEKGRVGQRRSLVTRGLVTAVVTGTLMGITFLFLYEVMWEQIAFLREYQMPGLKRWTESFVSTFLYQMHPFITIAALYAFWEAVRKRDPKFLIIGWLVVLIALMQIKRSRYVMVAFPMFTLMASYGLQRIRSSHLKKYVVHGIVAFSLVVAFAAYLPFTKRLGLVNVMNAGSYLNSLDSESVEVITVQSSETTVNAAVTVPILDLFTGKTLRYHYDEEAVLPGKDMSESSLRFTWEYRNPAYYETDSHHASSPGVIAVITASPVKNLPRDVVDKTKGYERAESFETSSGVFRFSPTVYVYVKK